MVTQEKINIPRYLYSQSPKGEEFITLTSIPLIGKVSRRGGKIRVYIIKSPIRLSPEEEMEICLKMKNWFYFSIENRKQA